MSFWRSLTGGPAGAPRAAHRGKPNARAYVIGDIHGRLDLLDRLLAAVEDDAAIAAPTENVIVFLGDLIDRGPDSAGVVERLATYRPPRIRPVFLGGNHEEVLLRIIEGEETLVEPWLKFGGAECCASYGLDPQRLRRLDEAVAAAEIRRAIPADHVSFLNAMGDSVRFGDYLMVHAGVRPGRPLEEQRRRDLRWIREPFLSDDRDHGYLVVHGHTVVREVEEFANRIAIDTGAVYSGVLTALVIDEDRRRYLTAHGTARNSAMSVALPVGAAAE